MRTALLTAVLLACLAGAAHAAAPSTVTWRGDATRDNRVTGAPEPPLGVLWAVDMGALVSYPVIAGGQVFVTVRNPGYEYGTWAVALDLATGAVRWSRPVAGTYYWSALAYDGGRLFLLTYDGALSALSPATGATLWERTLPGQSGFDGPPAAVGGRVYAAGAGSGGTVYAVRASDGALLWTRDIPWGGGGTLAVDGASVHTSLACDHMYAYALDTGATRWERHGDCSGGGANTPAVHNGRVYPMDGGIYDALNGTPLGRMESYGAPSFADGTAYVRWEGGLHAVDAATWAPRWRFPSQTVDGEPPLVSNGHVYVGSPEGYVLALERGSGRPAWCASTAGLPVGTGTGNLSEPDSGIGAGEGVLVVPADRFLVAYGRGGAAPAPCSAGMVIGGGGAGSGGGSTAVPTAPSLSLRPASTDVITGRRLRLSGRLAGTPAVAAVPVQVQADPWPFDGRWRPAANATTGADGAWTAQVRPRRNVRYRALAGGLTSEEATVFVDLAATIRRTERAGPTFRETVVLRGPRSTRLPRRVHFYVIRAGTRRARLQRSPRLRRVRPGLFRASARLRYVTPRRKTVVLACYRERRPDAWGRVYDIDPLCGQRRLVFPEPVAASAMRRFAR